MIKQLFSGMIKLYKWPVLVLVIVFLMSMLLGTVLPLDIKIIVLDAIGQKFDDILNGADTQIALTGRIFENNLIVAVIAYLLGFTIILPILLMITNGIIMGLFLSLLYRVDAMTPGVFLRSIISLVPHGIFELSAFFLASALSIMTVIKILFTKLIEPHKTRRQFWYESMLRFTIIIVPLLIVAGFTEVFVSNRVGDVVSSWVTKSHYSDSEKILLNNTFLSEHDCLLQPAELSALDTRPLGESLTATARVVYNQSLYDLLRQRKTISYWEEEYYCDNDEVISIQAWPANQWSAIQAQELQAAIFTEANLPIKTIKDTPYIITTEIGSITYYLGVFNYGTSTVMITWNADNARLYKELLDQKNLML